jgi:hypothetical protein
MKTILCAALVFLMTNSGWAEDFVIAPSDLLKVLPAGLQLTKGAPNLQPAIVLANEVLVKKAFGREVQMNLKFTTLEHQAQGLYGKCIAAQAEHATFGPVTIVPTVYFSPDQLEALATRDLAEGPLTFHGYIAKAEISQREDLKMHLDIVVARVGELAPKSKAKAGPTTVKVISAVYGSGKYQVDVTERVRKYVEQDKKPFWVNPADLGADPTPGWGKTLTVVYTKDGVRRLQARTETEYVLPESFSMPQDKEELEQWLIGTRWNAGREFIFLPEGLFLTAGQTARWRVLSDSRIEIDWLIGIKLECPFDYVWGSFTEQGGNNTKFTRVPLP